MAPHRPQWVTKSRFLTRTYQDLQDRTCPYMLLKSLAAQALAPTWPSKATAPLAYRSLWQRLMLGAFSAHSRSFIIKSSTPPPRDVELDHVLSPPEWGGRGSRTQAKYLILVCLRLCPLSTNPDCCWPVPTAAAGSAEARLFKATVILRPMSIKSVLVLLQQNLVATAAAWVSHWCLMPLPGSPCPGLFRS